VVAAAVMLDELQPIRGLADSKTLSPRRRERCTTRSAPRRCAAAWHGQASARDRYAEHPAGHAAGDARAVDALRLRPHWCWSTATGCRLKMPAHAIVGGDANVPAISAASIVAKVHRDRLCGELHRRYPQYGFASHKGYPTPAAPGGVALHGPCDEHRRSFAPVRGLLP
jgi:ribonuclease HII